MQYGPKRVHQYIAAGDERMYYTWFGWKEVNVLRERMWEPEGVVWRVPAWISYWNAVHRNYMMTQSLSLLDLLPFGGLEPPSLSLRRTAPCPPGCVIGPPLGVLRRWIARLSPCSEAFLYHWSALQDRLNANNGTNETIALTHSCSPVFQYRPQENIQ